MNVKGSPDAVRVAFRCSRKSCSAGFLGLMWRYHYAYPHVRASTTYYAIATQGSGERSVVQKVIVVPHASRP